jgi:two-component system nitrate/nitrite response regulator NarL
MRKRRKIKKDKLGVQEEPLSQRQLEITKLVLKGLSNKEISKKLNITEGTTRQHLVKIFKKLNVQTRLQLAAFYAGAEEATEEASEEVLEEV